MKKLFSRIWQAQENLVRYGSFGLIAATFVLLLTFLVLYVLFAERYL